MTSQSDDETILLHHDNVITKSNIYQEGAEGAKQFAQSFWSANEKVDNVLIIILSLEKYKTLSAIIDIWVNKA